MRIHRPAAAALFCLALAGPAMAQRISKFTLQPVAETATTLKRLASITATVTPGAAHIVEDSPDLITWHPVSPVLRPSGVLEWSHLQFDIKPSYGTSGLYQSAGGNWTTRRFYRVRELLPGNPMPAITGATVVPFGRLTQPVANGPYRITTVGGWTIRIQGTSMVITHPAGRDPYEMWGTGSGGTGHENLGGKHIKDNLGGSRTILLPDGTIITVELSTTPGTNTISRFSIYDGDQSHRLTTNADALGNPNTVIMSVGLRRAGEAEQADGETGRLLDTPGGLYLENIYTQSIPDSLPVPQESVPLGRTGGPAAPDVVNDYYDDPRLGHT